MEFSTQNLVEILSMILLNLPWKLAKLSKPMEALESNDITAPGKIG